MLKDKKILVPLNIYTEKNIPIPNPEYLYLKKEYLELTSVVPNENSNDEEFIGGMPVQLEKGCLKNLLQTDQKGNYVYQMTLKVDGERFLLFIGRDGIVYLIDRSVNFYYFVML